MTFLDLFRPKWKHSNPEVRKHAIVEISNQEKLAEIAKHSEHTAIRKASIEKITDQELLIYLIENEKESDVRITAIEKINNQEILIKLAISAEIDIRISAIKKITNQAVLSDIVKDKSNLDIVQDEAVNNINDKTLREELIKYLKLERKRRKEIKKIRNKKYYIIMMIPLIPTSELGIFKNGIPVIQDINGRLAICIFTDNAKASVFKTNFLQYASEQVKSVKIESIILSTLYTWNIMLDNISQVAINPVNDSGIFRCNETIWIDTIRP